MEKWLSAERYHPPGRENWNQTMLSLGPWPERGEYEVCHVFELSGPEDANIEKLVDLVNRRARFADLQTWHRNDEEERLKKTRATAEDMIRNRLPAYGGRAFASSRVARGFKTRPILRTAEELGLPTRPGMRTKPNPPLIAAS